MRDWEQRRRKPDAAARVLLLVIAHNPAAVDAAIRAAIATHEATISGDGAAAGQRSDRAA